MSELSALEGQQAVFNAGTLELSDLLADVVASLPDLPDDRTIAVVVDGAQGSTPVRGDGTRLRAAFSSILIALRREVIDSDRLCVRINGADEAWHIAIAGPSEIEAAAAADPSALDTFDEWRGGTGLSLAIARRIIGQHGGALHAPPGDGRAGAIVMLPRNAR